MATLQGYQYGAPTSYSAVDAFKYPAYDTKLRDYSQMMKEYSGQMGQILSPLQQQMQAYQAGGSYGQGQRQQAQENVAGGVANDMAQGVASGMTGTNIARGIQTRAGSELSKLYGNIEDTRNQLLNQATGNYAGTYAELMKGKTALFAQSPDPSKPGAASKRKVYYGGFGDPSNGTYYD
jgi:hypothetical protein